MKKQLWVLNYFLFLTLIFFAGCGDNDDNDQITVILSANKSEVMASYSDGVTLTAIVKDGKGAPVGNQAIQFNGPIENYNYSKQNKTNEDGLASLILSHPPVDPSWRDVIHITATSGGVTSNEVVITFINPQAPATVMLEADKTLAIADGKDKITFTATVKDPNGIPLVRERVLLNVPPGPYIIGTPSGTDYSGRATLGLYRRPDGLIGSQTISVTASCGDVISNAITITFLQPT